MPSARRIVCISDTHMRCRQVAIPEGDILIHAGDLTGRGSLAELGGELDWLRSLPHAHKVVIAGNHDFCFERLADEARALCGGLTYLEDAEAVVMGLRIWGSPWQPWFHDWAFNLRRGPEIRAKWDLIPAGIDVLVTHGPPFGLGDRTIEGDDVGCEDLLAAIGRIRPRHHVCGHIHEGWGMREKDGTAFINASLCDRAYRPVQKPIAFDL
jgi:Icc-related predicted phosphoesterase